MRYVPYQAGTNDAGRAVSFNGSLGIMARVV